MKIEHKIPRSIDTDHIQVKRFKVEIDDQLEADGVGCWPVEWSFKWWEPHESWQVKAECGELYWADLMPKDCIKEN